MYNAALPKHPVTGVEAIGIGKRGPIWPVIGGSVDTPPVDAPVTKPDVDKPKESGFSPITSQEVLDHIIQQRLARERQQYADYEKLKEKADKFDAAEAEKLSEIEKAQKIAREAQEEADRLRVENLRRDIAIEKGVPVNLLAGTTREEMEAAADELISWRGPGAQDKGVTPNPQQGRQSNGKPSGKAAGLAEVEKRFGKKA